MSSKPAALLLLIVLALVSASCRERARPHPGSQAPAQLRAGARLPPERALSADHGQLVRRGLRAGAVRRHEPCSAPARRVLDGDRPRPEPEPPSGRHARRLLPTRPGRLRGGRSARRQRLLRSCLERGVDEGRDVRPRRQDRDASRAPVLALLLRQPAASADDAGRHVLAVARRRLGARERHSRLAPAAGRGCLQPALLRPTEGVGERAEARGPGARTRSRTSRSARTRTTSHPGAGPLGSIPIAAACIPPALAPILPSLPFLQVVDQVVDGSGAGAVVGPPHSGVPVARIRVDRAPLLVELRRTLGRVGVLLHADPARPDPCRRRPGRSGTGEPGEPAELESGGGARLAAGAVSRA